MSQKFDDNEWQFYLIAFLTLIIVLLFVVAVKFFWVRIPDLSTPEGRCEAVCAGLGGEMLKRGYTETDPVTCFCDNKPPSFDKIYIRKP